MDSTDSYDKQVRYIRGYDVGVRGTNIHGGNHLTLAEVEIAAEPTKSSVALSGKFKSVKIINSKFDPAVLATIKTQTLIIVDCPLNEIPLVHKRVKNLILKHNGLLRFQPRQQLRMLIIEKNPIAELPEDPQVLFLEISVVCKVEFEFTRKVRKLSITGQPQPSAVLGQFPNLIRQPAFEIYEASPEDYSYADDMLILMGIDIDPLPYTEEFLDYDELPIDNTIHIQAWQELLTKIILTNTVICPDCINVIVDYFSSVNYRYQ